MTGKSPRHLEDATQAGWRHVTLLVCCCFFFCLNTWPQLSATVLALGGNYFPFTKLQNSYAD